MTATKLIIGSRGSDLALYQANFIRDILIGEHGCEVEIKIIQTAGDKIDNVSFDKMEGKGFFTKELEEALLKNEIDLAVHSLKDLMTTQPAGLKLGAAGYRADRSEMLLIRKSSRAGDGVIPVREGGIIGTSSARRKAQLHYHNPTLKINDLRGNVPTRIRKLREGLYDAILIASAGVKRLQLDVSDLDAIELDPQVFLPAPAQGILGIQIRENDPRVEAVIAKMGSQEELKQAELERGLLRKFGSGCSLPLGVWSDKQGEEYRLKAVLGVQYKDEWIGMKSADVQGTNIEQMVNRAYATLQGDSVCV
ncbi:MAG: hydroxymethylbilane synthase [bacterium]|nr:hydroxymethylbilane synthase [bacterium]